MRCEAACWLIILFRVKKRTGLMYLNALFDNMLMTLYPDAYFGSLFLTVMQVSSQVLERYSLKRAMPFCPPTLAGNILYGTMERTLFIEKLCRIL